MLCVTLARCAALEGVSNRNSYPYKTDAGMKVLYVSEARDECWLQLSGQIDERIRTVFTSVRNRPKADSRDYVSFGLRARPLQMSS